MSDNIVVVQKRYNVKYEVAALNLLFDHNVPEDDPNYQPQTKVLAGPYVSMEQALEYITTTAPEANWENFIRVVYSEE